MKKYWAKEHSFYGHKEYETMYCLLERLGELDSKESYNKYCKMVMDSLREWLNTDNCIAFGKYPNGDIVVIEFEHKAIDGQFFETKSDENGIYIEIPE